MCFGIRVIADIALLVAVVTLPWWAASILAIVAAFYFNKFYEILLLGICMDVLYGYEGVWPAFSTGALMVWAFALYLRPKLAFS